jgi:cobalt-zinc-cadmium efflux system outer membrane protein
MFVRCVKGWLALAVAAVVSTGGDVVAADPDRQVRALAVAVEDDAHLPPLPVPEEPVLPGAASGLEVESDAPWGLADFEAVALSHNPALTAASARVEAAHGKWVQAGLYPNTVVGYSGNELGIRHSSGKQGGFVSQRFITAGKLGLDRAVAAQDLGAAESEYTATHRRVLNDVRIRFYELLIAQQRVELTERLSQIGEDLAASSRNLLKGEQISRTNLLQAEIEAESAHILHDNAIGDHHEAWRRLCAVVGLPAMQLTDVEGRPDADLPEYSWDESLATLLHQSPELAAQTARVESARLAVCRTRRERIPNVDLNVAVRHDNATTDDTAAVEVAFPLPLLDRNQGNISRAKAELIAATADLRKTELALYDRLANVYREYTNARKQTQRYAGRILPWARKSLASVQRGYREGQVDYLTLLTTQRTYFQVNLDSLDALRRLRVAAVKLDGLLLTGSLDAAK